MDLRRTLARFLREDPALMQTALKRIRRLIQHDHSQFRPYTDLLVDLQDLKNKTTHEMELFANELAHMTDPHPANWRVVPLYQTRWYHRETPQEYQAAFAWTAPARRISFLVWFHHSTSAWRIEISETRCTPEEEKQDLEQDKALRDVIRTYTTKTDANQVWELQQTICRHFRYRPSDYITLDAWVLLNSELQTPGLAEPFFKRIAMTIESTASTWQVVPLCHTDYFDEQLPQRLQVAFEWTSQRYRARFLVYPSARRSDCGCTWSMCSSSIGTPDEERELDEDKALKHAIRTFTRLDTQSDAHAERIRQTVLSIRSVVGAIGTIHDWRTESPLLLSDTDLKSQAAAKPFFARIARIMDQNAQNLTWGVDMRGNWGFSWNSPRYDRDFRIQPWIFDPAKTYMIRVMATADAVSESETVEHADFFDTPDGSEASEGYDSESS